MKTTLAILDKMGENAAKIVLATLRKMSPGDKTCIGLATHSKLEEATNAESIQAKKLNAPIALGHASSSPATNGMEVLKLGNATLFFDGRIYSPGPPKGSVANVFANKMQNNYEDATENLLEKTEADFTLLIAQTANIVAARDPVGVQPLYYGENQALAALASNKKALWELGIGEPKSFPPGTIATVTQNGFNFRPVKILEYSEPKKITMKNAAETLQSLLENSVQIRVLGQKEVAVAFSGGLDSSLVALLAKRTGVCVHLVHVSLEGQPETAEARKAAELLKLPLQVHLFTVEDVEKIISKVVELIEEPDPIKASVGAPFFWNAQKAMESGYRVMLAGQGADELFGGYQRYVTVYLRDGEEKVRQTMFHDVAVIHESNIERDKKICGFHGVELRLPFASFEVAKFAMSLPVDLKFEKNMGSLRKLVLRQVARNMGLPEVISNKPKKAVQYSTGINSALKKLAKNHNCTMGEYVNSLFLERKMLEKRIK
jgi:asparagine synthase (glutamine-hydrolysing)